MKRIISLCILALLLLSGCSGSEAPAQIAATTLPVYEFTTLITQGTGITVTRLVTEEVSCLHDYSLNVRQVKAAEAAQYIVISGAGLEAFLDDLLVNASIIDASSGIELRSAEACRHDHEHDHESHHHEVDSHIWLSPVNAERMAENICHGLIRAYPQHEKAFLANLDALRVRIQELHAYGQTALASLSCRELITFHDGFGYFADAYDLEILQSVEEESGSEASALELTHLIEEVKNHALPAIFTEKNGSTSAASILVRETGCSQYALDMAMSGDSWFDAMYHNIDTIQEALG